MVLLVALVIYIFIYIYKRSVRFVDTLLYIYINMSCNDVVVSCYKLLNSCIIFSCFFSLSIGFR